MTAFRQVSRNQFDSEKDELLIQCYCGAEEYVQFAVLDKDEIESEYIDAGVDFEGDANYPKLLWITFSKIPASWHFWRRRLKNLWESFMGRRYSLTDTVLIDENAAIVLRDWLDEMIKERVDG